MEIFVKLIKAWFERRNAVGFLGDGLLRMLDDGRWMFQYLEEVFHEVHGVEVDIDRFYATDRRINRREQDIRERILAHMTLNPGRDVTECLVLMSVVKDAERVGDYCKNLFELLKDPTFPSLADVHPEIRRDLDEVRDEILAMFDQTKEVFSTENEDLSRQILRRRIRVKKRCDDLIIKATLGERYGLTPGQAVVCALDARFLRRISSHLENINSGVLMPVRKLDFHPRPE